MAAIKREAKEVAERDFYAELFEISKKIRDLEIIKNNLISDVILKMKYEKIDKLESPIGVISVVSKTSYTYSDKVKNLMETIKDIKSFEEEKGIATAEMSQSIRVTLR